MTKVYLIANNGFLNDSLIYKDYIDFDTKRKYRPLTVEGEKSAITMAKKKIFQNIDAMYSSTFFSSIDTAKYILEKNKNELIIDKRFDDRKVGNLTDPSLNLRNLQEHDFSYKLPNGESIDNVKNRTKSALKEIITDHEGENIAIFTHNIPIVALLSIWCEKGFNYEEKLMLSYDEKIIIDGLHTDNNIIELVFEKEDLKNITRID